MIIAIPCAEGKLCMHFGHCQEFAFVEVDENKSITGTRMITPPEHQPGVYPKWVKENNADLVIAGGMGVRAQDLFNEQGVKVVTGAPSDTPENIVNAYLSENLQTGENMCSH